MKKRNHNWPGLAGLVGYAANANYLEVIDELSLNEKTYPKKYPKLGREQWLGLDSIYNLTNSGQTMQLKVFMEMFNGSTATSIYKQFSIEDQV